MNKKLIITPKKIIYGILFFTIIFDTLIAELHFPSNIVYFNDFLWIILFVFLFKNRVLKRLKRRGLQSNIIILGIFTIILFASSIINFVDPLLVIWATRNTFRFYVFYISCIYYLDRDDLNNIFDYFFIVQILNFILAMYQYFLLGLSKDNLGGIFGHGNGMALNTFQAIVYAYFLASYFAKKQPLYKIMIITLSSIIIAALAEEKAYYIYFILVTILVVLFSRVSLKTGLVVIGCALLVPIALNLLEQIAGKGSLDILTNKEALIDYANYSYGLSRINPFIQIKKIFFGNSIIHNLLGLGFGKCEASGFQIFTSSFYKKFGYLQYMDFTHEKRFLETGYLGFATFLLLFIDNIRSMLVRIIRFRKRDYYVITALVINVIAIVSCWFSCALIVGEAYIIYFGIAIAGIIVKEQYENDIYMNRM